MLADIELGTINMIILKDVSRLGREHIDTNYYLGKYFPERNIRIVSILDNYDSSQNTYDELLEIDPYAASIVSQIYQLYLSGKGSKSIVTILNNEALLQAKIS